MAILYTGFLIVIGILFFVTLIEYITGAEKQGLKFIFWVMVIFILISLLSSLSRR